ncbi:MAG: 4-(cytidine 5'-diphospho)-2-C-methyl-D-erythritol kinase [Candidatus Marinimicrobia bacterium]|nr:4-(cytidine 5'-diphospho)-2-C-methyl-D-erythritol kinase [Candidatus Neomarinimicrobiota bacterium]
MALTLKSSAKVNIGLQVLGKRADGYHDIHTVFQELEFHDTITFTKEGEDISLTSNVAWFPTDDSNTCRKAYSIMRKQFSAIGGVKVHVEKQIPAGGGLGGGSGNAATVIKGLNILFDLGLTTSKMESIALKVGADVPFFIRGGAQLGDGTGENLTVLPHSVSGTYLLVIPDVSINTAWAYKSLRIGLKDRKQASNFSGFLQKDLIPFEIFENDFERIVIPAHPEIGTIKEQLYSVGARYASLSGSGSTVFGIFDDEVSAMEAESNFQHHYNTVLTFPVRI